MSDVIKPLIEPSNVTRYLWNTGVRNDAHAQLINDAKVSGELANAVDILIDRIQHRHASWYSHFKDALKHADLTNVVELLDIPQLNIGDVSL
ncbi:hypothetical protein DPMN_000381 [Dreissena polymorpha]|uniref:Uncharacterized protein n=1 Tax=Dreissena polymorpha TaxID=45954 RepID=A0A9D4MJH5_DREPO|nr:hypothetical protein DPMN_000381 [Dreissena polymorpha]